MKSKNEPNYKESSIPELDIVDLDEVELEMPEIEMPEPEECCAAETKELNTEAPKEEAPVQEKEVQKCPKAEEGEHGETDGGEPEPQEENQSARDPEAEEPEEKLPVRRRVPKAQEADEEEEEYPEERPSRKKIPSYVLHLGFILLLLIIGGIVFWRIWNYGNLKNLDDYQGNYDAEVLDYYMPLLTEEDPAVASDGELNIVAFGNAPFADDRDSEDGLLNMISKMTGADIYNCSVGDSYLAAEGPTLSADIAPMDAFNFYWLTTACCLRNNDFVYQDIFESLGDQMPEDGLEAYRTLMDIDFEKIDVVVLMYDASDYLDGRNMYSDENDTDIQCFTGNMCAGIDLLQATFPHIRIIVMSPTYAFAVKENGEYVSSDQYVYNDQDVLSTYMIKQFQYSYDRAVTFVDNLYGTIHEDIADEYLTDNLHLNVEGRRLVAERFVTALEYFDSKEQ